MRINREKCVGCGACINLCPRLAIRFIDHKSYIDPESCVECGTCREACGVEAIDAGCRFPDVLFFNFANDPFEEDDASFPPELKTSRDRLF